MADSAVELRHGNAAEERHQAKKAERERKPALQQEMEREADSTLLMAQAQIRSNFWQW